MKRLKLSLIILFIFLMVIFNWERLEWSTGIELGIHTFVYILALTAVVLLLIIPDKIKRLSIFVFMAIWACVYFVLRLTVFNTPPLFEVMNTYVTVTELAILMIAIALTYECASQLRQFEKFEEDVFMPPELGKRILNSEGAVEEIKTEFSRSRRHNIPLTLVVIQPSVTSIAKIKNEVNQVVEGIQRRMTGFFISASLVKIILAEARRTDLIVRRGENDSFLIVCPETKGEDVICLAQRIQEMAGKNLGIAISYGIASFPDEALTYDELLECAESQLFLLNPQQVKVSSFSSPS